ncbi:hypothetical protein BC834DRAFT_821582 [Gloeopeniophorella convolvens]|nr:hypothetical protein BC834DRAFT_821582 [Gloeopeniophorella convolvens]
MDSSTTTITSDPGSSSVPSPQCTVCLSHDSIYTCPRCAVRTCSLPCSTEHKTRTGCSGIRDKAKFVPMNRYSYGTMVDDYVFLEEMGRKVGEWGQDIVRGGFEATQSGRGRGRGSGMGRRGPTRGSAQKAKRDVLKLQLELRDIEVEQLPSGMERRGLNQSTWDMKRKTALLTVEYIIHPPPGYSPSDAQKSYRILTHRNDFNLPLLNLFQSHMSGLTKGKRGAGVPAWAKSLALPEPDSPDAFTPPHFFIRAPLDMSSGRREQFGYAELDGEQKFSTLLKHKQFVEFPTIEVWEEDAFRGILVEASGGIGLREGPRPAKRRKLDPSKGREAITGLLGDYGSEDEDEENEGVETALAQLGEYEGSEGGDEGADRSAEGSAASDDGEVGLEDQDDEGGPELPVDHAALLALIQQAQKRDEEDDDDEVDWGESDEDDEGKQGARL